MHMEFRLMAFRTHKKEGKERIIPQWLAHSAVVLCGLHCRTNHEPFRHKLVHFSRSPSNMEICHGTLTLTSISLWRDHVGINLRQARNVNYSFGARAFFAGEAEKFLNKQFNNFTPVHLLRPRQHHYSGFFFSLSFLSHHRECVFKLPGCLMLHNINKLFKTISLACLRHFIRLFLFLFGLPRNTAHWIELLFVGSCCICMKLIIKSGERTKNSSGTNWSIKLLELSCSSWSKGGGGEGR